MDPALVLAPEVKVVKLDFGSGQSPREGFEGVDLHAPDPKHRVDLWKFPYPWEENSVDELHCSHFVEHLPARDVEPRDINVDPRKASADGTTVRREDLRMLREESPFIGQDFFFAFFDECWRILKPDGIMTVIVPCARNNRAFQDPTHRRFIVAETFAYLWKDWRVAQKLDHYNVRCNFVSNVNHTMPTELQLKAQEVQARMFNECWNVIYDWHATLKAIK